MSNSNMPFYELLETVADNKFVLGDKMAEVGISAPELESSVASIALAQGELGQARHLYIWSFELQGIEQEVVEQSGKAFSKQLAIDNWISLIAGAYVINCAVNVLVQDMLDADKAGVRAKLSKLERELQEHIAFSRAWGEKMLDEQGKIPEVFRTALDDASSEVEAWLEQVDRATNLQEEGYLTGRGVLESYKQALAQLHATEREVV